MSTSVPWGNVAHRALTPYHVRNAALRAYSFSPRDPMARRSFRGMGQLMHLMEVSSPGVAIYRHAFGVENPENGTTQGSTTEGIGLGIGLTAGMLVALVAISAAINYQIGKAMAPSPRDEVRWAWGNAIGGTIFPPFTLGMAVYKNYFRE